MALSHRQAMLLMVLVTAMWSIAGVVTRQLESTHSFEVTFWRSLFTAISLFVILPLTQGLKALRRIVHAPRALWISGFCWAGMFTAFMVALTLTRVAAVLVTMAVGPLLTALVARLFFGQPVARGTWIAIAVAGVGMAWMFVPALQDDDSRHLFGSLVALLVPLSAAVNWSVLRQAQQHGEARGESAPDLVGAVLIGGVLSALVTLPLAWPLQASLHDIGWLALLGLVQLAIPCALVVVCTRVLPAPEIALLALLEVLFGTLLAWVGAGEVPGPELLSGGLLVLLALLGNAWCSTRRSF